MGWVPTHGPDCVKVTSRKTQCPRCKLEVVYFECSCGSKVLLTPPNGGEHICIGRQDYKHPPIVRRWGANDVG